MTEVWVQLTVPEARAAVRGLVGLQAPSLAQNRPTGDRETAAETAETKLRAALRGRGREQCGEWRC